MLRVLRTQRFQQVTLCAGLLQLHSVPQPAPHQKQQLPAAPHASCATLSTVSARALSARAPPAQRGPPAAWPAPRWRLAARLRASHKPVSQGSALRPASSPQHRRPTRPFLAAQQGQQAQRAAQQAELWSLLQPRLEVPENLNVWKMVVEGGDPVELIQDNEKTATHLIVMVNGLFGTPSNWNVVAEKLQARADPAATLLFVSRSNSLVATFEGIDVCGERLMAEIQDYARSHLALQRISVVGHSMGGLIARYAVGKLYEPASGRICGLKPCHFITMATPHLGCDGEGPAQVPFIGWTSAIPLAGAGLQRALVAAATPFASTFMGRTGQQFFLTDAKNGDTPLLVKMSQDSPQDGYFFSSLAAFVTRTCYANSSGDHIVGWANSSVRHPDELPLLPDTRQAMGVVREDPLRAGMRAPRRHGSHAGDGTPAADRLAWGAQRAGDVDHRQQAGGAGAPAGAGAWNAAEAKPSNTDAEAVSPADAEPGAGGRPSGGARRGVPGQRDSSAGGAGSPAGHGGGGPDADGGGGGGSWRLEEGPGGSLLRRPADLAAGSAPSSPRSPSSAPGTVGSLPARKRSQELRDAEQTVNESPAALLMLERLQELPWRRIDVSFAGAKIPYLAHTAIQVTRRWMSTAMGLGDAVADHLAQQVAAMDADPLVRAALEEDK